MRWQDGVKGTITMPANDVDHVLLKSNGIPTYHFAHAVDDHLMRVNLVIRGEEWISSVPTHLQLFDALGFERVEYAHIAPLMKQQGGSRRKLSKRKDPEASVEYFIEAGYPAEAVQYYLRGLVNARLADLPLAEALASPISLAECGVAGPLVDLVKLEDIAADHVATLSGPEIIEKYRQAGLDEKEAMYAALIEGMDKSLGDLMAHLEKAGHAKDTVVLFMSDNGGLSAHARGGRRDTHNLPLSFGKGSLHEGGIREPMIVKWPGTTAPGTVCASPVIIEDFFPTLLGIAGAKAPACDGVDFAPLLKGGAGDAGRAFLWHYPNFWNAESAIPGYGPGSAVRKGDWKYIFWHDPAHQPREELFNLKDDLGEKNNLAEKEPAKRREMAALLRERLKAAGAQMPVVKATGKTVELP